LVAERRFTTATAEDPNRPFSLRSDLFRALVTFHFVCLTWVFFRAPNFSVALHYLAGIAKLRPGPLDINEIATLGFASIAVLIIDVAQRRARDHTAILQWPAAVRGTAYGAMLLPIIVFSGGTPVPFIYFRF
jgi:D-alanyl-lipoteichoic acid acyltransferase DltB (MBOAT superfamily)